MIPEGFAVFAIYAATFLWDAISLLAFADSVLAWREEKAGWRIARDFGNGRQIVAEGRLKIARWFNAGFFFALLVAVVATAGLLLDPEPRLDTNGSTMVLRFVLISTIFSFWMAKRTNRATRRRLDAMRDLAETVEETNQTVHRIERKVEGDGPV